MTQYLCEAKKVWRSSLKLSHAASSYVLPAAAAASPGSVRFRRIGGEER